MPLAQPVTFWQTKVDLFAAGGNPIFWHKVALISPSASEQTKLEMTVGLKVNLLPKGQVTKRQQDFNYHSPNRHWLCQWHPPIMSDHRKLLQRFHDPGDIHELTFSVYRREKLLTNNAWRGYLSESITQSCQENRCLLAAFVYMPEHVHLLIWGIQSKEQVSDFLAAAKQPMSACVRADLEATHSPLLHRLMIHEPEKQVFRFWQAGAGYDRNLKTVKAVQASIEYIHRNPVERGLCRNAIDWRWSSARYYASDCQEIDPLHPLITPLPREFWLGGWQ